jgi:hypothetical protein
VRKLRSLHRGLAVAALAGAAVLAGPAVTAMAAPASATSAGWFTLCSDGYYGSYATFTARGGSTLIVWPGACYSLNVLGSNDEPVELHMVDGTYIGATTYNDAIGETVRTLSTPWGPTFSVSYD